MAVRALSSCAILNLIKSYAIVPGKIFHLTLSD